MKRVTVTFDVSTEDDAEAVEMVREFLMCARYWLDATVRHPLDAVDYTIREVG